MRQSLTETYNKIYLLDLHGSAKKKEKHPDGSKDENVFDIEQGVGIGIFVNQKRNANFSSPQHPQELRTEVRVPSIRHAHLFGVRENPNDNGK